MAKRTGKKSAGAKKPRKAPATARGTSQPKTSHHKDSLSFRRAVRALARRLRKERNDRSWTIEEAAEHFGVEPMTIHRLETGDSNPTLATLVSVAGALGLTVSELLDNA